MEEIRKTGGRGIRLSTGNVGKNPGMSRSAQSQSTPPSRGETFEKGISGIKGSKLDAFRKANSAKPGSEVFPTPSKQEVDKILGTGTLRIAGLTDKGLEAYRKDPYMMSPDSENVIPPSTLKWGKVIG